MALFTEANAVEMGKRSARVRKERELKREQERALVLAAPPATAELTADYSKAKADRTRKQIELCDQMIDQCGDADTLDSLTRSKERLFRIWAHLAGIPGPGNLKPSSKPAQARHATVQPIGPAPQQAVVPPTEPQS